MEFNKVAEAGGLTEAMERAGTRLDPVHAIGKLLFWLVMLVVILLPAPRSASKASTRCSG